MMISGLSFGQQLINEVQRDSIVSKILKGEEAQQKLILANEVICQADKVIEAQKNVVKSQDEVIENLKKSIKLTEENTLNYKKIITVKDKEIKTEKRKGVLKFVKGMILGAVVGAVAISI